MTTLNAQIRIAKLNDDYSVWLHFTQPDGPDGAVIHAGYYALVESGTIAAEAILESQRKVLGLAGVKINVLPLALESY